MRAQLRLCITTLLFCWGGFVSANQPIAIAVMDFTSKGGVTAKQMDALSDMLANEIRAKGNYRVIGKSDIKSMIDLESNKISLGCNDDSCLAEIGGALGVNWVVIGNVSKFGQSYLLNLKMIDVRNAVVAASISKKIDQGQEALIDRLVPAIHKMFDLWEKKYNIEGHANSSSIGLTTGSDGKLADSYNLWGHIGVWGGLAIVAFGGVSAFMASKYGDDYAASPSAGEKDSSRTWAGCMYASFGIGAALIATGLTLWFMAPDDSRTESAVTGLGVAPTDQGMVFSWSTRW
jgi:TolB-like protein